MPWRAVAALVGAVAVAEVVRETWRLVRGRRSATEWLDRLEAEAHGSTSPPGGTPPVPPGKV